MQCRSERIVLLVQARRELLDRRIGSARVLSIPCALQYDLHANELAPVGPQYGVVHLGYCVQQARWHSRVDEITMGLKIVVVG